MIPRPTRLLAAFLTLAAAGLTAHAASPFAVDATKVPPAARAPLGVNIEGVRDYARTPTFVDAIKQSRAFGTADAPWDGKAKLDADGWPLGDFGIVVIADVPNISGTYKLSFKGAADVQANASPAVTKNAVTKSGRTTADVEVAKAATQLFLSFKNARDVKDIRLIRPGYDADTKQTFTTPLLDAMAPFTTLRLMDFTNTNNSPVEKWADRTLPSAPTQASEKGVAWEYAIQLANETKKDIWVNVPDQADDDYVKQLAKLLKNSLDKDLKIYVEYSNEVWNWQFRQTERNQKAARLEVAEDIEAGRKPILMDSDKEKNDYYLGMRRVSKRIVEISNLFRAEFGDDAMFSRVRPILASQIANPFMLRMQLDFMDRNYGKPSKFVYAVAGAPYFGLPDIVNLKKDRTPDHVLAALKKSVDEFRTVYGTYQALALHHGVKNFCYEAGVDVQGEESFKAKFDAQFDPRMQNLVETFLHDWYASGGELACYYTLCGSYTKYGTWGLTDDLTKETPKTKAVVTVAQTPRPAVTFGAPVPGAFDATKPTIRDGGNIMDAPDGSKYIGSLGLNSQAFSLLFAKEAGKFDISLETASSGGDGKVELAVDGKTLGEISVPKTKDGNTFATTDTLTADLPPGQHALRLRITNPGLNLKSIRITSPQPAARD